MVFLTVAGTLPAFGEEKGNVSRGERLFALNVRPLLAEKCLACHGKNRKKIESGLDLTTRAGMLKGGEVSDHVLVPKDAGKSLLYIAATWEDPSCEMPPKENDRLTKEQTWWIRDWINAGAPWPSDDKIARIIEAQTSEQGRITVKTSGGLSEEWDNRQYNIADLWAYQPITKPAVPWDALKEGQARHPIDAFIQRKLNEQNLSRASPADSRTLLRRLTYDLTGLPPTPESVKSFLHGDDKTYEATIEKLLNSPRYGEQWARHWLDITRYGDTSGFSRDDPRPQAWRYRDYVIRSFNADKPFDQFVIEQIAGDELAESDPEYLIAVSFLRMGPWEHTGMSVAAVTRQQYLDDVTNSIGETFLGQVLRCAKCHDHKFDPIPTRDYYRLMATLAPVQLAEREVPFLAAENTSDLKDLKARYEKLLSDARQELAAIHRKNRLAEVQWLKERGIETNLKKLAATIKKLPEDQGPPRNIGLDYTDLGVQKVLRKRIEYFERMLLTAEPYAQSVYSGPPRLYSSNRPMMPLPKNLQGEAEPVFILKGGSLESPGDRALPGLLSATLSFRQEVSEKDIEPMPTATVGRRLALARWIADPNNPFAARVIVNRVWQHHFGGRGLVGTPNNFGITGKRPTHPELLDFLASWFIEHGWSLKKLHRLILTSETYRRRGRPTDLKAIQERDPGNALLSYYPPRRLDAEEIRDSLLMLSGETRPDDGRPRRISGDSSRSRHAADSRHGFRGPGVAAFATPRPAQPPHDLYLSAAQSGLPEIGSFQPAGIPSELRTPGANHRHAAGFHLDEFRIQPFPRFGNGEAIGRALPQTRRANPAGVRAGLSSGTHTQAVRTSVGSFQKNDGLSPNPSARKNAAPETSRPAHGGGNDRRGILLDRTTRSYFPHLLEWISSGLSARSSPC